MGDWLQLQSLELSKWRKTWIRERPNGLFVMVRGIPWAANRKGFSPTPISQIGKPHRSAKTLAKTHFNSIKTLETYEISLLCSWFFGVVYRFAVFFWSSEASQGTNPAPLPRTSPKAPRLRARGPWWPSMLGFGDHSEEGLRRIYLGYIVKSGFIWVYLFQDML